VTIFDRASLPRGSTMDPLVFHLNLLEQVSSKDSSPQCHPLSTPNRSNQSLTKLRLKAYFLSKGCRISHELKETGLNFPCVLPDSVDSLHYSINTKLEIIGIKRCNRRFHITEVLILIKKRLVQRTEVNCVCYEEWCENNCDDPLLCLVFTPESSCGCP